MYGASEPLEDGVTEIEESIEANVVERKLHLGLGFRV